MTRNPLALILVLLAACGTSARSAIPTAAAAESPPGERVYRSRCSSCHRLRDPTEQTREGWADVMKRMASRAHLSDAERDAVLSFLKERAKDSVPAR